MAFTVKYGDTYSGVILKTNDGGKWERKSFGATDVFIGYGGENSVVIQTSYMQDGSTSVVVTHNQCDCCIIVRSVHIRNNFDMVEVTRVINLMIKEILEA